MVKNLLIKAENLAALHYLLEDKMLKGQIDLVYIDPPFATGGNFTITGNRASTISSPRDGDLAYSDKITGEEFLDFLRPRLLILRELMSERGSIYLHIDYKMGHYVKLLMDEIFGIENFRNDITRIKCNPKNFNRIGYGNIKDLILFYSKNKPIWNEPKEPYTNRDLKKLFPKMDPEGRRYTTVPIHAPGETKQGKSNQPFRGLLPPPGRHWRTDVKTLERWDQEGLIEWSRTGNPRKIIFADQQEGKRVQDIWEYKDPQYPSYPTEKNSDLLDLIIRTSSDEDSIVLDCFCGSGTALKSAYLSQRKWIGVDQSEHAIRVTKIKIESVEDESLLGKSGYEFVELKSNK